VFLLDEPLSNVDARMRDQLRRYIRDLQRRLRVTMLYVTHDHGEAMSLGDRVAVFEQGRLLQVGAPIELFERPATRFVAEFLGSPPMNLLPATYGDGQLQFDGLAPHVPEDLRRLLGPARRSVLVGIRPEAFTAAEVAPEAVVATIDAASAERLGSETLVSARLGNSSVTVRLPGSPRTLPERVGAPMDAIHLFDAESGQRLG
jgi:ABC-type sugar transport system ATPase subunit